MFSLVFSRVAFRWVFGVPHHGVLMETGTVLLCCLLGVLGWCSRMVFSCGVLLVIGMAAGERAGELIVGEVLV